MTSTTKYGCCSSRNSTADDLRCSQCRMVFHYGCIERAGKKPQKDLTPEYKKSWICSACNNKRLKDSANTTIHASQTNSEEQDNVTFRKKDTSLALLTNDINFREIIREEISQLLDQFKTNILHQFDLCNQEVLKRLNVVNESLNNVKQDLDMKEGIITGLQAENKELQSSIVDLQRRLSQVEQHSRSCNVEIQCVPEFKTENLFKTIKQIADTVKFNINEAEIHNCTRILKLNKESKRPRSIIVKFSCPKVRNEFLAAAISYNKKATTKMNKLNTSDLGIAGEKRLIYICEHLSPAMKHLHAAARAKAKDLNYKFVWVKGGNIYLRKDELSEYKFIKSVESLSVLK